MTAAPEFVLTFTAAGLLRVSCAQMAALRLGCGDWSLARKEGLDANLLQARTPTTGKRIWRELEARLSPLPVPALELLSNGTAAQQLQILWLALCPRYALEEGVSVVIPRVAAGYGPNIPTRSLRASSSPCSRPPPRPWFTATRRPRPV